MNIVLLSGGSGKRLWPLSNESMSKQFLELLTDDDGKKESMVHRVSRQLASAIPKPNLLVSTTASHIDSVHSQLGSDVAVAVEPERRDTFPAMVLSAAHLHFEQGCPLSDAVTILPIDVYTSSEYFFALPKMEELLLSSSVNLVLMGIAPTHPSEKYGYLKITDDRVSGFKEKPTEAEATALISSGALWNSGVYCMQLGYVLGLAKKYISFNSYEDVLSSYRQLPKTSADYEIAEKEPSIGCIIHHGSWKDLGTWNTLTEEMAGTILSKAPVIAQGCEGTHVINTLDTPIIAMGIRNAVIVASYDGILVADKDQSSFLKPLAEQFPSRAMYERRRWGRYRVLDYVVREDGSGALTKRLAIEEGRGMGCHIHHKRTEVWTVISGSGLVQLNGVPQNIAAGDVVTIPKDTKHSVSATTALEIIEVQFGSELLVEDIEWF
ncbi:MAG: cupin domain-containing protein [Clostridiales bacterium]|jgi:mannose-1-phosphate guanylyltransferase|nr:cupin domain-containing protein [Clostridiales bacterium]